MSIDLSRTSGKPALGTYTFKVIRTSEHDGEAAPYWRLICQIQDKSPDQGKEVMLQLSTSSAARWKLEEVLDAIDAPRKGNAEHSIFMGKLFRANVIYETNKQNGQEKVGLNNFMPYNSQGALPGFQPSEATPGVAANIPEELGGDDEEPEEVIPF